MRIRDWRSDVVYSVLRDVMLHCLVLLFFFIKQKTAYEMRISDWSSDVCSSDLTLADRRIYNLLIANAWERISEPVIHRIAKTALKGTHQGNERIESSLLRLMGTIAIVTIRKGGKSYKRRVQLLGSSDESLEKDGFLHYRIPEELIEILRNSEVYARLKTQVMYCFESKYALCLY